MTSLSPVSRRKLLRGALAVGAAGVVGGVAVEAFTTGASAQTDPQAAGGTAEPVVAHVRDVASGDIDIFVGTKLVRLKDPQLAARLAQAAR